jgi:hypothetical protein
MAHFTTFPIYRQNCQIVAQLREKRRSDLVFRGIKPAVRISKTRLSGSGIDATKWFKITHLFMEDPQISRDGKQFLYSRVKTTGDICVLNFAK